MEKYKTSSDNADSMWTLVERLFPIHRTLVNDGFRKSLEIIRENLELNILEYDSGLHVWDWIIPDAWNVKTAYIKDMGGNMLVDFKENNLHLAAYSCPFAGRLTGNEVMEHLWSLPDQPEAIPYRTLYYSKNEWRFCIAHQDMTKFRKDEYYDVVVDVESKPGKLCIGEYYLPGRIPQEIIVSSYLCHPSLANDNLSGVIVSVELMKVLRRLKNRKYSYRLLIVPEAIGSTTWLATHESDLKNILGGYVFTCCGDRGNITYKKSYFGEALVDRMAVFAINEKYGPGIAHIRDFWPNGSDEQKFNAPGVRIPFGSIMRTPYSEFSEYHTSRDNLDYISKEMLRDTLDTAMRVMHILENNETLKNRYRGEPFLTKHGIYRSTDLKKPDRFSHAYIQRVLMMEMDGKHSLVDIAGKWGYAFDDVHEVSRLFLEAGLVESI